MRTWPHIYRCRVKMKISEGKKHKHFIKEKLTHQTVGEGGGPVTRAGVDSYGFSAGGWALVEQYMALTAKHRPVAKYFDLHFIQKSITTSIWTEKESLKCKKDDPRKV